MPEANAQVPAFRNRPGALYWLLAAALVAYVALCTGNRDNKIGADAWEHHRVLVALTNNIWNPGNPTQASDEPSIRYSPSNVALAAVCRLTGADPYRALSAMAVVNTVLLVAGVALLLAGFGRAGAAGSALLIMVSLYGGAPAYANSYALSDLPWHQVNPSALSFALALIMMAALRRVLLGGSAWVWGAVVSLLLPVAVLDHAMTGIFAAVGLGVIAVLGEPRRRWPAIAVVGIAGCVAAGACLAWPWFDFLRAVRSKPDLAYWFTPGILMQMLFVWCMPAAVLSLFSLLSADRRTVQTLLAGAGACFGLGVGAMIVKSPTLARLPLPGLVFLHMAVALYADEARLFDVRSWPARLRSLLAVPPGAALQAITQTAVAATIVYFLVPQAIDVIKEPHLARPLLAPLMGARNLQITLRADLGRLLEGIGERDVVLSDLTTSWAIPSARGRIVGALHYEFFAPDQAGKESDTVRFFQEGVPGSLRAEIIRRQGVRWIVLDSTQIPSGVYASLIEPSAVVRQEGSLVLMDATKWLEAAGAPR
ncbi:MAG: hypothetical protein KF745_09690 [Phycisphaeraceae bacterium]|nr:hypothetical protein [Phycisphaeraceae bacterium]